MPSRKIIFLSPFIIIVSMLLSFVFFKEESYISIPCYILSAYALTILIIYIGREIKFKIKEVLFKNKHLKRYFTDISFKTVVSLYISLSINLFYVIFNLCISFSLKSFWFLTLAIYYLILTLMRFLLLRKTKIECLGMNQSEEYKKYTISAYILLIINIALSGITILVMHKEGSFHYPSYLIYVMAIYCFYNIISSLISIIRYRRYASPVIVASKVVRFASALISIFALEIAMLETFDTRADDYFKNTMILITGFVIAFVIIGISSYMIIKAKRFTSLKEELQL